MVRGPTVVLSSLWGRKEDPHPISQSQVKGVPGDPNCKHGIPAEGGSPALSPSGREDGEGDCGICAFITHFIALDTYGPGVVLRALYAL